MVTYLRLEGRTFVEEELPIVPPHIDYDTVEIGEAAGKSKKYGPRGNVTRLYRTNECGEPTDGDPISVRWDEKLAAYVKV